MPFSLFECRDGTFVVVPRGLAPPLAAYQAHGESIHLSDSCHHLYDTAVWDDVSREVDRQLYAVVHSDVAFYLFEVAAGAPRDANGVAPLDTRAPLGAPASRASHVRGRRRAAHGEPQESGSSQVATESQGAPDDVVARETT